MTGKTHRVGGMLGGLIGFSVLKDKGLLIQDVSEPLQLVVMYASSMYGSVLLDMDHDWSKCPSKDVISWVIWKILHLTTPIRKFLLRDGKIRKWLYKKLKGLLEFFDSKHRSWQTHSDLTLMLILYLIITLPSKVGLTMDGVLITLLGEGILFGVISHLSLDMLTTDGIWSFILAPVKLIKKSAKKDTKDWLARLSLVPDIKFFSTDDSNTPWERLIRGIMKVVIVFVMIRIVYLWSPYRFTFSL